MEVFSGSTDIQHSFKYSSLFEAQVLTLFEGVGVSSNGSFSGSTDLCQHSLQVPQYDDGIWGSVSFSSIRIKWKCSLVLRIYYNTPFKYSTVMTSLFEGVEYRVWECAPSSFYSNLMEVFSGSTATVPDEISPYESAAACKLIQPLLQSLPRVNCKGSKVTANKLQNSRSDDSHFTIR
ncbi:hypothetical protein CEXT_266971 [Caerostris extrusa]|uniref:Uncharacterized protein n=1 Tax=Caerostris extrusa TaxID=172846 RepID=A0AAV4SIN5_CAEEX|nr:hypothetical protein CEXT_266971 [Caerostris extrusa]